MNSTMQFLRRPSTRLLAAAITALTARLLITDGFHYPMLLLLSHVTIAFVLEIASRPKQKQTLAIEHDITRNVRVRQLVHAFFVAASLVFGYLSFLHLSNTTFWIMVVSLNRSIVGSSGPPKTWIMAIGCIVQLLSVSLLSVLVIAQEHRLTDVGLRLLVIAIICLDASSRFHNVPGDLTSGRTLRLDNHMLPLAASIPAAVIAFIWVEVWDAGDIHLTGRIPILVVNAIAGAIMLGSTGSMRQRTSADDEGPSLLEKTGIRWILSSILLTLVMGIDNEVALSRPTTTTTGQWSAFLLASVVTLSFEGYLNIRPRQNATPVLDKEAGEEDQKSPLMPRGPHSTIENNEIVSDATLLWRQRASALFHCALHGLAWLFVINYILSLHPIVASPPPIANGSNTTYDIDIVIARYDEPLDEVANTMNSLLELVTFNNLKTRVIVYNKGDPLNSTYAKDHFSANEVLIRPLENVGREAETYLSHILHLDNEDLADHTLFIQAEPHDLTWTKIRLQQYFTQETGFLSLSNVGRFCADCDHCGDLSGWFIDPATLREIYSQSNPNRGECRDISLTYRGQFIVSRQRLQDLNTQNVQALRERVLESKPFGYTMERLWGVVFGCTNIESTCPSLMSGSAGNFAPGGVGDCQCLD